MELLQGLLLGFLSGFLIFYTFQPNQSYPMFITNLSNQPWVFIILFLLVWVLLYVDHRIALLLLIILIMIVIDIEFLGRVSLSKI